MNINEIKAMKDDELREAFRRMLEEDMTTLELWNWVKSWKNARSIIEEAKNWNLNTMEESLIDWGNGEFSMRCEICGKDL